MFRIRFAAGWVGVFVCGLAPFVAHAVPAFSRQTEQSCSSCHVGSFGPQLNSFGRDFKLNGYTLGTDEASWKNFSAMVLGGFERTAKDLPPGSSDKLDNNNWTADQISLFYAGSLAPHLGLFMQATYDGVADAFHWDNLDLRYSDTTKLADKDFVYGVTVNNNPGVQDLWQTTPSWMFPYAASGIAPRPDAGPYMASLGQTVGGAGLYSMWDNLLYTELSGYTTLWDNMQRGMGVKGVSSSDHLDGIAPYWRVALQQTFGPHYVALGTFGMYSRRYPGNDHSAGTDSLLDNAIDATYQYSSGNHAFSLYGSVLHEEQNLDATQTTGGSANPNDSLNFVNLNASYYYNNTYGLTVGRFLSQGSSDALLYPDASNHRPDSAGTTLQLDVTPFGKDTSLGATYFNVRFFAQYVAYDKFNGLRNNYDGTGRNAADNNTLYVGAWLSF